MRWLVLLVLLAAACGASTQPAQESPQPEQVSPNPQAQQPPAEPADTRCAAPQRWIEPGCGMESTFAAGCYTLCSRPGATEAERLDPSACGAGFTCTSVMRRPWMSEAGGGVADVCGTEDALCMPGS